MIVCCTIPRASLDRRVGWSEANLGTCLAIDPGPIAAKPDVPQVVAVPSWKYRSPQRKALLQRCGRLLAGRRGVPATF